MPGLRGGRGNELPGFELGYPPLPSMPLPALGQVSSGLPVRPGSSRRSSGKVFSVQLLWKPAVVLSRPDAVREALVHRSEDTAGRPPSLVYSHLGFGPKCVVLAQYGEAWKEQRRFSLTTLRNLGLGKQSLERWVTAEADFLCSAFAAREGRAFDPSHLLTCSVTNVISSLTYANRFDYEDRKLQRLLELLERSLKEDVGLLRELSCLSVIPPVFCFFFFNLLPSPARPGGRRLAPGAPPYPPPLCPQAKGTPGSSFTPANLRMVVADLFTAGMVTTATTLRWALLLLLLHPDVQRESPGAPQKMVGVQEEVDVVIGRSRRPTMKDQAHMPFTNAVIHEVQRFGDIVPLGIPHMTTRDTEIQGFFIPKGTVLITNLSSVLKDEATWEQPYRFYPEHFLDAEGRFVKPEAFMPFSAGRRVCLGEPLAKMELFLFFTCLLQDFSFVLPPGHSKPSDKAEVSFLSAPQPFQLCAVPR
uniref:Cytochrome P450 n=1 Tax=Monodelphis domestica TaxID=13616 RepID=A0A5F8GAI5_MONDO